MESNEKARILTIMRSNPELKRLYERHKVLEERIAEFSRRKFLTDGEQVEHRQLKSVKLREVDRMMEILANHEVGAAPP